MAGFKILIVEDEEIVAEFIHECLNEFGHETIAVCSTGEEAIEVVKNKKPDLALMDITLKGKLNGVEAV